MGSKEVEKYQEELFDQFGYNFGFVSDLLEKYLEDTSSVSDYWQSYFEKLVNGNGAAAAKAASQTGKQSPEPPKKSSVQTQAVPVYYDIAESDETKLITGVGSKIIENMESSLTIPTATSLRTVSVKLLEENRRIINQHIKRMREKKVSYTHIVAFAIIQAAKKFPMMNNSYAQIEGKPHLVNKKDVNFGIAVDMTRKDGSRSLMVPNIKKADKMDFKKFMNSYDDLIARARSGQIEPSDFQNTTMTLTNPGGIGTVSSTPRLMTGQGTIIAIGAIDYPSEFKAMHRTAFASLGIGKVMNITSTYDHRIIQGAESGEFLAQVDSLLLGEDNFYETIFSDLDIPQMPVGWGVDTTPRIEHAGGQSKEEIEKQARILQLINMYRVRGHLIANLNPLQEQEVYFEELDPVYYGFSIWDYDREFITGNLQGLATGTLREILEALHITYCERIGAEYMHIQQPEEKAWLQSKMEPIRNNPPYNEELKKRIMEKLIIAEAFEHFLHTKFIGHKRFSLEGSETVIPVMDYLLSLAADEGVQEVFLGMAHRGRLNVLTNIIGKAKENIFHEFEDEIDPDSPAGTGDVKYHLGATGSYDTLSNKKIQVSVSSNPSHLEFVNPVVEGIVRAKQTRSEDKERNTIIPLLLHGDAAFAGQGIVAETLNLSGLGGYKTGGTIHLIINNQIGFTTSPEDARSSPYATDVAKMVQAPIFHVNGDDPEASLWVTKLAFEYRMKFHKDVVIDLFGYRRHGHNEGDDPVYTQPIMYKKIKAHPSVKQIYAKQLIEEGILKEKDIEKMDKKAYDDLDKALKDAKKKKHDFKVDRPHAITNELYNAHKPSERTAVSFEALSEVVKGITSFPDDFALNPKLKKHIGKRKEFLTGNAHIDWAFGEALAFGSLLLEGHPVRLSGQDSARGTFSQRHLILTDMNDGHEILPHNFIKDGQAKLEALDSLLSEAAVLGYEYGYSCSDPLALVCWEAQFGDFANGAQVIIDNFIASSYTKWHMPNSIVMLLPHGQEGQGPEHSSARIERFLTLCADNNMYVTNPTTPAQYFHLLRRQVAGKLERPLVVMTPKSLLRLPAARSRTNEFTEGRFQEIIDDTTVENKENVVRVILASGKVYYDLEKHKNINEIKDTAILRIEQYYPYPENILKDIFKSYSNAKKLVWVQEEPKNMGAWTFLYPRLESLITSKQKLENVCRKESSSPASGSTKIHQQEQQKLVSDAFSI